MANGGCSLNPPVACYNTRGGRTCGACPAGYQVKVSQIKKRVWIILNLNFCFPAQTDLWENSNFHNFFQEVQNNPYRFLNLRHY